MYKFLIRLPKDTTTSKDLSQPNHAQETKNSDDANHDQASKRSRVELSNLPADPGLRKKNSEYDPNQQDEIRRWYLQKGPCQPRKHNFPQRNIGGAIRRFNSDWFDLHISWLEYSINKDAIFCLCCYVFKPDSGKQAGGDCFVTTGFRTWNKTERLVGHVGDCKSAHNQAWKKCSDLMKQDQHIYFTFNKQTDEMKKEYRIKLLASIDCIRFLLLQGLAFRGHDESIDSSNRGNFIELLNFLANHNEVIKEVVVGRIQKNLKLTSPDIQKEIVSCSSSETINAIVREIGDEYFAILVDESRDVSGKEQMALVLRYVDKRGFITERLIGIVHVTDTNALSLKSAVENLLLKHSLNVSRVRGQGYDGASNMSGQFNGLKSLILKENPAAYYVHCFAHQLQLTLVAVAKNHFDIAVFFELVSNVVNVIGASCKRRDNVRETQAAKVAQAIDNGEIQSGRGLNQETTLKRAGDTRWGSHYESILNLTDLYSTVGDVLEDIEEHGLLVEKRIEARVLLDYLHSFEFAFNLFLMKKILGRTNDLSQLQKKDQDILNAMRQVKVCKKRLQEMRDEGWEPLLDQVLLFCGVHKISIPVMDDIFVMRGRPRRKAQQITNGYHYRVDIFNQVVDMQLQELNSRFTEVNSKLLTCIASFDPSDQFSAFKKDDLLELAKLYPLEFSNVEISLLDDQLENYIVDMLSLDVF